MKTKTLKKAIYITLFGVMLLTTVIISKNIIANIKQLYRTEKVNNTITTCIWEMIY